MCLPLELRFFGTCLEDLGRKDFDVFRDVEPKANNIKDISDITSNSIILLSDRVGRSKLIVFLALLNSSNRGGANVLYNILINSLEYGDIEFCLVDNTAASEILLLFTMAFHHPAFTFVQKSRLAERLESIEKFCSSAFLNDEPSISSKQSIYEVRLN
ncbi:zinc finger CCHC domain-containing protein 2-like [Tachypleus tridentatus]|uniref:zinc finger CCHC domain-containing protein 2-like n=1 Tax=Tachypleus tridentatus TaxID=6853 RepID=UPI003FD1F21D